MEWFKNHVNDSKSYPGADINSDHNLVMMCCDLKLKRLKIKERRPWDISKLLISQLYECDGNNQFRKRGRRTVGYYKMSRNKRSNIRSEASDRETHE